MSWAIQSGLIGAEAGATGHEILNHESSRPEDQRGGKRLTQVNPGCQAPGRFDHEVFHIGAIDSSAPWLAASSDGLSRLVSVVGVSLLHVFGETPGRLCGAAAAPAHAKLSRTSTSANRVDSKMAA